MNKEKLKKKVVDGTTAVVEQTTETVADIGEFAWKHPSVFGFAVGTVLCWICWIFYCYVIHRGECIDKIVWKKWKDFL